MPIYGSHTRALASAMFIAAALSNPAQAEILPWLANTLTGGATDDPFHSEKKANSMIPPALKPDSCIGVTDIKGKLHLNEVVIAVLCNDPDAKSAYLSLLGQAASTAGGYSAYLPNASATTDRSRTTTISSYGVTKSIGRSYGISAGLTLWDFGQREASIEEAELALTAGGYSYTSTLQGMIATALESYFQLLTAQNAVGIAKESERFAKESYDAAALKHKIGQVPLADELSAKVAYSQAQLSTQQTNNQLSQNQAALALLMGLPADKIFEVAELDDSALTKDPFNNKVEELMEKAKQTRVDLLAGQKSIESAEISLRALKRADMATLSATANMGAGGEQFNVLGRNGSRSNTIGISVSIPLFNGFSQLYGERSAELALESQKIQYGKSELGVEQDVWNSWHNYQTARQSWEVSWDQIANATLLKNVALGRYKEGLGTILDVLNAENQYSGALQSQLQLRYNLLTTRVDLVRAVGVLDLDTMRPEATVEPPAPEPVITKE